MCIDFPGRVVALEADVAVVDTEGRRRRATTLLIGDVAVGDWVTVAAGTIVDRLTAQEAASIRRLLQGAETVSLKTLEGPSHPSRKEGPDVHDH